jgi:hypothetical protein
LMVWEVLSAFGAHATALSCHILQAINQLRSLIETELFPRILSKDIPVLKNIYQFVVTFHDLQAKHKKYLSLKSHQGFASLTKPSI